MLLCTSAQPALNSHWRNDGKQLLDYRRNNIKRFKLNYKEKVGAMAFNGVKQKSMAHRSHELSILIQHRMEEGIWRVGGDKIHHHAQYAECKILNVECLPYHHVLHIYKNSLNHKQMEVERERCKHKKYAYNVYTLLIFAFALHEYTMYMMNTERSGIGCEWQGWSVKCSCQML